MAEQTAQRLRALPSVDRLLKHSRCAALLARFNHDYVTQKCREVLEQLRAEIRQAPSPSGDLHEDAIMGRVEARIAAGSRPGHVRVVNATGTILHQPGTPCSASSHRRDDCGGRRSDQFEYDLAAGKRGRRKKRYGLLVELTGAEGDGRQ
jgi:L-seryl-tRNA(Ser) seleniumtransferase